MRIFLSTLLSALLLLFLTPANPASAADVSLFPWQSRQVPEGGDTTVPQEDMRGDWISSFDPGRRLTITEDSFELLGIAGGLRGSARVSGPLLILTEDEGSVCAVYWQLLGDGRLSINSGEELYHRPGEPALPPVLVRQFGAPDCRFTVTVPARTPMTEIEDGVRIYTQEKDAAMQILSGTTYMKAEEFARDICEQLNGQDFRQVEEGTQAYTFSCTVNNIEMIQYVAMEGRQYINVTLIGDYSKLISYLHKVRIVKPEQMMQP